MLAVYNFKNMLYKALSFILVLAFISIDTNPPQVVLSPMNQGLVHIAPPQLSNGFSLIDALLLLQVALSTGTLMVYVLDKTLNRPVVSKSRSNSNTTSTTTEDVLVPCSYHLNTSDDVLVFSSDPPDKLTHASDTSSSPLKHITDADPRHPQISCSNIKIPVIMAFSQDDNEGQEEDPEMNIILPRNLKGRKAYKHISKNKNTIVKMISPPATQTSSFYSRQFLHKHLQDDQEQMILNFIKYFNSLDVTNFSITNLSTCKITLTSTTKMKIKIARKWGNQQYSRKIYPKVERVAKVLNFLR